MTSRCFTSKASFSLWSLCRTLCLIVVSYTSPPVHSTPLVSMPQSTTEHRHAIPLLRVDNLRFIHFILSIALLLRVVVLATNFGYFNFLQLPEHTITCCSKARQMKAQLGVVHAKAGGRAAFSSQLASVHWKDLSPSFLSRRSVERKHEFGNSTECRRSKHGIDNPTKGNPVPVPALQCSLSNYSAHRLYVYFNVTHLRI